jgi:hypothetical protein
MAVGRKDIFILTALIINTSIPVEEITLVLPLLLVAGEEENEHGSPLPPRNILNQRTLPRPILMKTSRNGNYVLNTSAKQRRNKVCFS